MQITISGVNYLGECVWGAALLPDELSVIGSASLQRGEISVVLLPDLVAPDEEAESLCFNPSHAEVLNQGDTNRTLFIFGSSEGAGPEVVGEKYGPAVQNDDQRYREELEQELPPELVKAGTQLLERVRNEFGGYFRIATKSSRYVNRPDNFWTAKVQPRDQSIAVTVRGRPDSFDALPDTLTVKPDRGSYSRFKIERGDQLDAAWRVVRQAGQR